MRVPASVQVALVSTGIVIAMGATGCSKNVEQVTAAETSLASDVPADSTAKEWRDERPSKPTDRDSLSKTDLRSPDLRSDLRDGPLESRPAPNNAWMFRGGEREESVATNVTPVSTIASPGQAGIVPPPQQPTITPPVKPPPVQTVVAPPRPPGWQIRAACGRG
jgi:hypothetical protein